MPPATVVSTVQESYITLSRSYLDFFLEFPFETTPDDLPLTGLETVTYGWDGTDVVRNREKDEFLIDEIRVRDFIRVVVEIGTRLRVLGE